MNFIHPYQSNQLNQSILNNDALQMQWQQQHGQNKIGSHISMNTQSDNFVVDEENESIIQQEIEQEQDQQQYENSQQGQLGSGKSLGQVSFQNTQMSTNGKQQYSNKIGGSTETLQCYPNRIVQSCNYLHQKKAEKTSSAATTAFSTKKNISKKFTEVGNQFYSTSKSFKSAQDLPFQQQAFSAASHPLEKQEYSDEERKGEKKLSPHLSDKQSNNKIEFLAHEIKVNSSCQLSHHSQSHSSSSSSCSVSSHSSSSSVKNQQNEEINNELQKQHQTEYDFSLVPLTKSVWSKSSEAAFGDCHVELSIQRDQTAENRFISFQYWRPCSQYTIDQTSQIARFFCEPNFNIRTSDFTSCIAIYKNYPDQSIQRWGHVLEMYQSWTSILYNEADFFYKKLNANPSLKKYFEEKMDNFMQEALKKVNCLLLDEQGGNKKNLFCYSLRKLNEEYKDIGSIQYGYSRGLVDILGPDPQETRLFLQRYGLNYFFDQKTRIERYIHDFQYIQQGGQIYDRVTVITLDKIEIELKVSNQYIYYDFFQDPRAQEVFGDFSECARLVRKFAGCKMEIFEIDSHQQQKLQVERQIYKPIYEKEKYLTFDSQLLSLYYKNEVKSFKNGKASSQRKNKNSHKFSSDNDELIDQNINNNYNHDNNNNNNQNSGNNFLQFSNNAFGDGVSFEKKEEDHFQNFQFESYSNHME